MFEDDQLMERFAAGSLVWEPRDIGPWQAGRAIAGAFSTDAVKSFRSALEYLSRLDPPLRTHIVEGSNVSPDERLEVADRIIKTLVEAITVGA